MPPYEKQLLEKVAKLTEENNEMLRSIRAASRWQWTFFAVKWIFIIAVTLGAYYYIQPYLDTLWGVYGSMSSLAQPEAQSGNSLLNLPEIKTLQNLLN